MKSILTILATLTTLFAFAQEPVTWVGGTPGQENSWHVATNWSNHQVPDEDTRVIINNPNTGHHSQPVISQPTEVLSIDIYNGAVLTISAKGGISIDGTYDYTDGIQFDGGALINDGYVVLKNTDDLSDENLYTGIQGSGLVMVNDHALKNADIAVK